MWTAESRLRGPRLKVPRRSRQTRVGWPNPVVAHTLRGPSLNQNPNPHTRAPIDPMTARTHAGAGLFATIRRRIEPLTPFFGLAIFAVALWVLRRELTAVSWEEVRGALEAIPALRILGALGLTALSFAILTGHDRLALRYAGVALSRGRSAFGSFVGYAFSQSLGFPVFTGGAIRYRIYGSWGVAASDVWRIVGFCALGFWVGFLMLTGLLLVIAPPAAGIESLLPGGAEGLAPAARILGLLLLVPLVAYLVLGRLRSEPIELGGVRVDLPRPGLALRQMGLGLIDWTVAGTVLFVLLPEGHGLALTHFLLLYAIAQTAGVVSHVPGGLGVFELVLVLFLPAELGEGAILASLLAWRAVYFLTPLLAATGALAFFEYRSRRAVVDRAVGAFGRGMSAVSPVLLAGGTFLGGVVLLVSGSLPAAPAYLTWIDGFLPEAILEISHFVGSLVGAALLVLSWGLLQRLDAAYQMTLGLLLLGAVLSLLRGFEIIPALTLLVLFATLLPARRQFFRQSSLTREPFSPGWIAMIGMVLLGAAWMGSLAYGTDAFSGDLWWSFSLGGDASRFMRGTTGAAGLLMIAGALRLLRPAVPPELLRPPRPLPPEIPKILEGTGRASAMLVHTGDKALLLSKSGESFLMYAVEGRSWVALGDPIGPVEEWEELIWRFRKLAFVHRGWPVFYQVRPESLTLYLDAGLSLLKLGEEGRVPLTGLSLEGGRWKDLRQSMNRAEREGIEFQILGPSEVRDVLPRLREVSDHWLDSRNAREKGFSLGAFGADYLTRTPVGVARKGDEILGFVNVLAPGVRREISADLMRYRPDAMKGVMEYLFAHLFLYGRDQGYEYFSMGMAPLSGLDSRPLAPLWNRFGTAIFRHGEHFYNFQGLRAYKEKFNPEWQPRYLACPGGLALPRILTNVGTLIGGGVRGITGR